MKRIIVFLTFAMLGWTTLSAKDKIVGTVLGKNNQPIVGVYVLAEKSKKVITTDIDGRFEIDVPAGTPLTFSYMGFEDVVEPAENDMVVIMSDKLRVGILLAEYGFNVVNSIGHNIGIRFGQCRKAGWYIGARYVTSDFKFNQSEGTLDSNEMINDPSADYGRPIMSGISSFNQFSISAGVMWRMGIPLYGYVGGGYGYRQTLYETSTGVWLNRSNVSPHLGLAELGFIGDIHHFALSIGCEVIFTESIEVYPKIGIGYTFNTKKSHKGSKK